MKAIVLVCTLFLSTAVANADVITYGFADATANFEFNVSQGVYDLATAEITGTFTLDTATQTITGVGINLSGLPSYSGIVSTQQLVIPFGSSRHRSL